MKRSRFYRISLALSLSFVALFSACSREEELTLDEINRIIAAGKGEILEKTVSKPWRGEPFVDGKVGGTWYSSMTEDPKSFNLQVAERDATTAGVVSRFHDYLVDYDYVRHEYRPHCASFEIVTDEKHDRLSVIYTLRDDLWWSFYGSDRKVKVTSDDVVFWYKEIEGDPGFQSSSYNGHFVTMPDGSQKEITIEKLDDRRFAFRFPRIVANPLLATNREFGPRFIYEPAKKAGGVDGVLALFSVASDPKQIPSMGTDFLVEYTPAQRLVFKRNPDYWKKDGTGAAVPYPEESIVQIVPRREHPTPSLQRGKAGFVRPEADGPRRAHQPEERRLYGLRCRGFPRRELLELQRKPEERGDAAIRVVHEKGVQAGDELPPEPRSDSYANLSRARRAEARLLPRSEPVL